MYQSGGLHGRRGTPRGANGGRSLRQLLRLALLLQFGGGGELGALHPQLPLARGDRAGGLRRQLRRVATQGAAAWPPYARRGGHGHVQGLLRGLDRVRRPTSQEIQGFKAFKERFQLLNGFQMWVRTSWPGGPTRNQAKVGNVEESHKSNEGTGRKTGTQEDADGVGQGVRAVSGADKSKPVIRSAKGEEMNQVHRPTTRHAILGMDGPISVKGHIICYSDIYIYMSISPLSMYIYTDIVYSMGRPGPCGAWAAPLAPAWPASPPAWASPAPSAPLPVPVAASARPSAPAARGGCTGDSASTSGSGRPRQAEAERRGPPCCLADRRRPCPARRKELLSI